MKMQLFLLIFLVVQAVWACTTDADCGDGTCDSYLQTCDCNFGATGDNCEECLTSFQSYDDTSKTCSADGGMIALIVIPIIICLPCIPCFLFCIVGCLVAIKLSLALVAASISLFIGAIVFTIVALVTAPIWIVGICVILLIASAILLIITIICIPNIVCSFTGGSLLVAKSREGYASSCLGAPPFIILFFFVFTLPLNAGLTVASTIFTLFIFPPFIFFLITPPGWPLVIIIVAVAATNALMLATNVFLVCFNCGAVFHHCFFGQSDRQKVNRQRYRGAPRVDNRPFLQQSEAQNEYVGVVPQQINEYGTYAPMDEEQENIEDFKNIQDTSGDVVKKNVEQNISATYPVEAVEEVDNSTAMQQDFMQPTSNQPMVQNPLVNMNMNEIEVNQVEVNMGNEINQQMIIAPPPELMSELNMDEN